MRRIWERRLLGGDRGLTLIELMVSMLLMGILSGLVLDAYVSTTRTLRHDTNESQGLDDVNKVVERLGRDIRDARGIAPGADASHLVLWIDSDSDYIDQPSENVEWQLQATSGGHYNVVRIVPSGATIVEANTLITNIAFSYPTANEVVTSMTYNQLQISSAANRVSTFTERLRNVP